MTDPHQSELSESEQAEQPAGPGVEGPGEASTTDSADSAPADAPAEPERPARPQAPAMTPAEIAQNPTALVRVSCDGRCGAPRDLYARDTMPADADGEPLVDPRAVLMEAAGCTDEPAACPGAVSASAERDTFDAVTGLGTLDGPGIGGVDLSQLVHRVRGGDRDPELQPDVAASGVAPIPMLTVDDLEQAANGEVRLPIATSPFDPPPSPMLAALGVDVENLQPVLAGLPPDKVRVESGDEVPPGDGNDGVSGDSDDSEDSGSDDGAGDERGDGADA